jgi:hypothetical protein
LPVDGWGGSLGLSSFGDFEMAATTYNSAFNSSFFSKMGRIAGTSSGTFSWTFF